MLSSCIFMILYYNYCITLSKAQTKGAINMQQVLDFLNKANVYYLATTDGDQPHVRPLGFVMEHDGKLMFCTGNNKPMFKQMLKNPKVELCACIGQETLRICGKVVVSTTLETKQKALDYMPMLKELYNENDGVFEIFYIDEATAILCDMAGNNQELPL